MNLYGYAGNNPVAFSDPYGLSDCDKEKDRNCSTVQQAVDAANEWIKDKIASAGQAIAELNAAVNPMAGILGALIKRDPSTGAPLSTGGAVGTGLVAMAGFTGPLSAEAKAAARLTSSQAKDLAGYLGYTRGVRGARLNTMGQKMFSNGRTMIAQDITMHQGVNATWKMFDPEFNRLGTFDGLLLNRLGK